MNAKIVTYTGKYFDLLDPQPEMVWIEDIAHSLAYQCRYTGHTREFYSVAQHCVLMAESGLPGGPLKLLLHDAAEAYIGDIARPWKQLLQVTTPKSFYSNFPSVRDFESRIQEVIGLALGVDLSESAEVKVVDHRMMATEIRDLMPEADDWGLPLGTEPLKEAIRPRRPEWAEQAFLAEYEHLKKLDY